MNRSARRCQRGDTLAAMKLGLINSAWAQAGKGTRFGIEQTKRIGFDTIDILTDPLDIDDAERKMIGHVARDLGLPIKSLCWWPSG